MLYLFPSEYERLLWCSTREKSNQKKDSTSVDGTGISEHIFSSLLAVHMDLLHLILKLGARLSNLGATSHFAGSVLN